MEGRLFTKLLHHKRLGFALLFTGWLFVQSCQKDPLPAVEIRPAAFKVPSHFSEPVIPDDNYPTLERIELGKALFFETRLSANNNLSCASCHKPEFAFADTVKLHAGTEGNSGTRNTPSIINSAWLPYLLREGSVPDLERQILVPIQEQHEFNNNILKIVSILKEDPYYSDMAQKAYGRAFDAWVLTRALSSYERSLVGANSAYDKWLLGDSKAMSLDAIEGMYLFKDKLNCGSCHSGVLLTNYEFVNNGLYEVYSDPGRMRFTRQKEDEGKFKTPSLRNIAITLPYMHDGSLANLDAVIDHYAKGGSRHPNKDAKIEPFEISDLQKKQLKAFLEALTDK